MQDFGLGYEKTHHELYALLLCVLPSLAVQIPVLLLIFALLDFQVKNTIFFYCMLSSYESGTEISGSGSTYCGGLE